MTCQDTTISYKIKSCLREFDHLSRAKRHDSETKRMDETKTLNILGVN